MANATKKSTNSRKGNPPKRDWMEEEDKQAAQPPSLADKIADRVADKLAKSTEPKAARKHNETSYRWLAIKIIKDNPGLPQEKLIALMAKAATDAGKPAKDAKYWKRRIGRAYKLATRFNVVLPNKPSSVNKPARGKAAPAMVAADGAEEV